MKYGNVESPNDCDIDETHSECESHPEEACGEPISHEVNLFIIDPITKLYCVVVLNGKGIHENETAMFPY